MKSEWFHKGREMREGVLKISIDMKIVGTYHLWRLTFNILGTIFPNASKWKIANANAERSARRYQTTLENAYEELLLSLIHISEPTRLLSISYAVFCLKKKKQRYTE